MKITIGTKNKAKGLAVQTICNEFLENAVFTMLDVPSNVAAQPIGDDETLQGAKNRAELAMAETQSDLAFGLEGGVKLFDGAFYVCNWGVLLSKNGQQFIAGGAQFPLPEEVRQSIQLGEELGPVMDRYTKQSGIRHHEGAIGVFTNGLVNRAEMFEHVVKILIGQYLKENSREQTT